MVLNPILGSGESIGISHDGASTSFIAPEPVPTLC